MEANPSAYSGLNRASTMLAGILLMLNVLAIPMLFGAMTLRRSVVQGSDLPPLSYYVGFGITVLGPVLLAIAAAIVVLRLNRSGHIVSWPLWLAVVLQVLAGMFGVWLMVGHFGLPG